MKKLIVLPLIIFLLLSIMGCRNSAIDETNELVELKNEIVDRNDKLIIGTMEIEPFMFFENGEMVGPNIDIVSKALDNIEYEYEFKILPWSRLIESVKNGDIDIAFALSNIRTYLNLL